MNNNQPVLARLIQRTAGDYGFLFVNFLIAVAAFCVCATLFWLAVGTIPIVIGLPLLAVCLMVAGEFARVNRQLLATRGITITAPQLRPPAGGIGGLRGRLSAGSAWRGLVHVVVNFFVSIVTFVVGTVWFVAGPGGVLYGWWSHWLPNQSASGLAYLLGYPGHFADTLVNTSVGAILLITSPWVMRGLVTVHTGIAKALLQSYATVPYAAVGRPSSEYAGTGRF